MPVEPPRVLEPALGVVGLDGPGRHCRGGVDEQARDLPRVLRDRPSRESGLDGRWERDVDQHPDGRADEGLHDPTDARRLGRGDVAHAEHEHRADRHLQQVRAEPQDLARDDRGGDEDAEAPPVQPDHRHEPDRQHHAEHHREHPLHAVDQRARQGGLHHQQRGERRDQRRRIGKAHRLGHDERGHGGAGDPQCAEQRRPPALPAAAHELGEKPADRSRGTTPPRRVGPGHPPMPTQRVGVGQAATAAGPTEDEVAGGAEHLLTELGDEPVDPALPAAQRAGLACRDRPQVVLAHQPGQAAGDLDQLLGVVAHVGEPVEPAQEAVLADREVQRLRQQLVEDLVDLEVVAVLGARLRSGEHLRAPQRREQRERQVEVDVRVDPGGGAGQQRRLLAAVEDDPPRPWHVRADRHGPHRAEVAHGEAGVERADERRRLESTRGEPLRHLGRRRDVEVVEAHRRAAAACEDVLELGQDAQHLVDGSVAVERGDPAEVTGPQLHGARDVRPGGHGYHSLA